MRFARHQLRVVDLRRSVDFYVRVLGMTLYDDQTSALLGYSADNCLLELIDGAEKPAEPDRNNVYWKIGLTVGNLDAAVRHVRDAGWQVSDPHQFEDIGYLCHLTDPDGLPIELLQRGFEGNEMPFAGDHPVADQATLAHLTLRTRNLDQVHAYCTGELGLRLLSVQPVVKYGFCLYFYALGDETPPNPSLEAVENREWLWARPYTVLEVQHLLGDGPAVSKSDSNAAGLSKITFELDGGNNEIVTQRLNIDRFCDTVE